MLKNPIFRYFAVFCVFTLYGCSLPVKNDENIETFIREMAENHHFAQENLAELFDKVEIKPDIIEKISKPSESLPWHKYRKIFLKEPRIRAGVEYLRKHEDALAAVERKTGVPATTIVAIIGVETYYGKHTGQYRVIDALSTLAFSYPPRSQFFRKELEQFLLFCRDEYIDPLTPTGSYAGAMGIPQFMPSSFINYAVDFNHDSKRDIWRNHDDAIASVANYFVKHGWQRGQTVAVKFRDGSQKNHQPSSFLKENLSLIKSNATDPNISKPLLSTQKAKIIAFEQENGEELWALSNNFFVITRYNKSPLYAMAVYQLSLAISNLNSISSFSSPYEKDSHPVTFDHAGKRMLH